MRQKCKCGKVERKWAGMQVVLKVVGGKNDGREIKIAVPRFIIGRGETAHLRPSSDLVSREHCEIVITEDGKVRIADLKSRNGTFVNGEQLTASHFASSGDSLRVGRLQFEVVIDPVKASTKKPKVSGVVEAASRAASSGRKSSLEDSISDWLTDDEDETPSEIGRIASAETLQLSVEETSVFGAGGKQRRDEERRLAKAQAEDEASESGGKGKKKPMKLPKQEKESHTDSTTAADDVLRKFFKRR